VLLPVCVVLATAISVLIGWTFGPRAFAWIFFGETAPNTAFAFLLLAMALLLLDNGRWQLRAVSRVCALCAALIGALTGFAGANPGRMSPVTTANLVLLGIAILLLDFRFWRFSPSLLLTWLTALISFLTLTGYAYNPAALHQLRMFAQVSLYSPLAFLLLCTAILFSRPEQGMVAILLRQDLGGEAARRLLPGAIFIPFAVSLLIFKIFHAGTYGSPLMVFLFFVAPVMTFVPLVLLGASLLSRMASERKQSEEELRISTLRFSSVVASAMDAIITLDESLRIIVFNKAAEKMFGCQAQDVLGAPLDRFLPEQYREIHSKHIYAFGEAGVTTRSMEAPGILSAVRANGEQFPIEATVSQVQVAGQKLYTVILRDITERKRAEETLRQSEARFRSIYEQAAVGIEQVAFDGQLLMVNAALCRMLGYEEIELLGKKTEEITHRDDHAREVELLNATLRENKQSYEIEKRYLHRNGSVVWVHVTSSVVNDSAGEPLYRISVIQNVTERKRTEEQLKQAQKMEAIGRLAGGVAHDFNTLLNVMLGYSELLLAELPLGDSRREKVMQIKNSGNTGAMLTKQLLAFSRKQAIAREVMDLREVASKLTPILGRLLRDDVELTVKCSVEACPVKVDPGQMQQLVLNLVANAGDAMPDGGQICIEVRAVELDKTYVQQHPALKVGRYAMLAISDSGVGMDSETVAHIFEPFFTTKEAKGTGLGLATVYGIVKRNGGDIWVYSEQGVGTIFKVFLPLTVEPLQQAEPVTFEARRSGGCGETILLVEDSAALRELTKVMLLRDGYHILEAEDGVAALEIAGNFQGSIHLLLTDVVMPRMRGPEVAERFLKQRPGIAVVFLSGYTEEVISQSDGIKDFTLVEKPYTAEALLRSIRRALDDSSSRATFKIVS
jgi:two-component system cell cycle sensor histidine kinase/response regulator CckA